MIPTLAGSPDIADPPGTGNSQYNDDFNEDSAGPPTGWTLLNAPSTCNTTDSLSQLHIAAGTSNSIAGIYKAIGAATFPLTVTARITEALLNTEGVASCVGFFLSPVAPGSAGTGMAIVISQTTASPPVPQVQYGTINMATFAWTKIANSILQVPGNAGIYLQMLGLDNTGENFQFNWSYGGRSFVQMEPEESIAAAAAYVGIFANGNGSNFDQDCYVDWIRFH